MRTRISVFLVAANLLLFGFIFYLNHTGHRDRAAREQSNKVFGPEAANLDFLEIKIADQEPRVLRLESDTWNIESPIEWPANFFAVNRILQQLEFLERETSFHTSDLDSNGQGLEPYGLADPRIVLTFGRGEERHKVLVGAPTDIGSHLYILDPSGEWVHVVQREFAAALSLNLSELQSETIFHIPLFEVRSLNLQLGTHSKVRLARSDTDWAFETPFQTRADRKAVEAVINRLNGLRVNHFTGLNDLAAAGLDNPAMRITLEGNSRRETLLVGSPVPEREGQVYAKLADNPTIFTVDVAPLQVIENAQDLLRDRKLLHFVRNEVTSINVAAPGQSEVLLQKLETDDWQIVSRYADQSVRILPADASLVQRLLARLDDTYVLRFVNDAPSDADLASYGFDQPQRTITLSGSAGLTLILGSFVPDSDNTALYAKLGNSRFVHSIDASILQETPADTQHFRNRLLLPQPEGSTITAIRVRDLNTGETLFETALAPPENNWATAAGELPEVQRAAVLQLLPELRDLRVERYVKDDFSTTVNFNGNQVKFAYALEADLLLVGGDSPLESHLEILLTKRLGGQTVLGGSRQLNVIFAARQQLIDALTPLLFDPPMPEQTESAGVAPATQ